MGMRWRFANLDIWKCVKKCFVCFFHRQKKSALGGRLSEHVENKGRKKFEYHFFVQYFKDFYQKLQRRQCWVLASLMNFLTSSCAPKLDLFFCSKDSQTKRGTKNSNKSWFFFFRHDADFILTKRVFGLTKRALTAVHFRNGLYKSLSF